MTMQRSLARRVLSPSRSTTTRRTLLAASIAASLALAGCGDGDDDYDFDQSRADFEASEAARVAAAGGPQSVFDPLNAELPFPIDLLFSGSEDGTLNIPVASDPDSGEPLNPADPLLSLNQLDGFSTVAPIRAAASEALDPSSVTLGDGVRVFEVDASPAGAVTGVIREVGPTELVARAIDASVVLLPVQPLKSNTRYLAILTSAITDTDGNGLSPSLFYGLAKNEEAYTQGLASFEPVRQLTQTHLAAAASQQIDPDAIALSWTFKTQSLREPLQAAEDLVTSQMLLLAPAPGDATSPLGKANIWIGTLALPYYLDAASADEPQSFQAALNSVWRNDSQAPVNPLDWTPVATETVTVPVLMTVPNAESANGGAVPDGGWPVTVFQHGITGNRSQMLAIADAMADAGRIVIAIDQPLHGIVNTTPSADDPTAAFNAANTPFAETERHFGIDVADNASGAAGPDGNIDASGSHFINLQNLGNSRDNLRQAAADLMTLSQSIAGAVVATGPDSAVAAADAGLPLNTGDKNFVGHSLGGMAGITFLSYDDSFQSASLAMPGGGIAQLLANSGSFGPVINGGLAAAGIETGSAEYEQFLVAAQTAVDSADPINHAATLGADMSTGVHLIQVDGDNTIPNGVPTAPLSGTLPLAPQLGTPQLDQSTATNRAFVRFQVGDHGTVLRPSEGDAGVAATIEMQRQIAGFAASLGQALQINDEASVITPVVSE